MPPRRWISVAVPVVCLIAFVIWLVLQFSQGDLDRGDKLASIVSMSVTIITLPLSVFAIVITIRQSRPVAPAVGLSERLDALAEALAIAVRAQWEAEEQVRRIHDPFPLPARWTASPEHLMDHWQNIWGDPAAAALGDGVPGRRAPARGVAAGGWRVPVPTCPPPGSSRGGVWVPSRTCVDASGMS